MATNPDLNATCLVKGTERYIFLWSDSQIEPLIETFVRFADNPDLSFNSIDAVQLATAARLRVKPRMAFVPANRIEDARLAEGE